MAFQLILEFAGVGVDEYRAVNESLGIDADRREGWPDGMVAHTGGTTDDGGLVVTEIWATKEAQGAFMDSRLGPALGANQMPSPVRLTWLDLIADVRL
ncbi:MAG: hypothetical protein JWM89_1590 [Acidimicrobiales bacterium]|nr:hypothetical protein [Acidimicrobiales bacterium]